MEIKITKKILANKDLYLSLHVDDKEYNVFFIGEDADKGTLNTVFNLYGESVRAILKKGTVADKNYGKTE